MPELNESTADRLSTIESRAQRWKVLFNYSMFGLLALIALILFDAILTNGPIWPPFLWLGGGVLVVALFGRAKVKSTTETYLDALIEVVEHGLTHPSLETIEGRMDSLEDHFETAESLAEGLQDDELQDQAAAARYRLDRWWIETLLTRAESLEQESRSQSAQDNPASALDAANEAWTLYIRAASAVNKCDEAVMYDPSIAAPLGIDVTNDGLSTLESVGSTRRRRLHNAGFETIREIRQANPEDLAKIESIGDSTAAQIIESVEAYPIVDRLEEKRTESREKVDILETVVAKVEANVEGSTPSKTSGDSSQESSFAMASLEETSNGSESTVATESRTNPNRTKVKSEGLSNALERIESFAEPDGRVIDHVKQARRLIRSDGEPPDRPTLIQIHNTLGLALSTAGDNEDPEIGSWLEGVLEGIETHLDNADGQQVEVSAQDKNSSRSTPEKSKDRSEETEPHEEALLAELRRIAENQPGAITRGDVWAKGRFEPKIYESVFGSWEAAAEAAAADDEDTLGVAGSIGDGEPSATESNTAQDQQEGPAAEIVETDQTRALTDLPEGRLDSLVISVESIDERNGNVRDQELTVITANGERLRLTIWTTHDVSNPWTEGERYKLTDVRHKVWDNDDADEGRYHALSSTRDMTASRIERAEENGFEFVDESLDGESEVGDTEESESESDIVTRLMKDIQFEENP